MDNNIFIFLKSRRKNLVVLERNCLGQPNCSRMIRSENWRQGIILLSQNGMGKEGSWPNLLQLDNSRAISPLSLSLSLPLPPSLSVYTDWQHDTGKVIPWRSNRCVPDVSINHRISTARLARYSHMQATEREKGIQRLVTLETLRVFPRCLYAELRY